MLLANCFKERGNCDKKPKELSGRWIAADISDTLEFTSENSYNKSNGYMVSDHYYHLLFKDSIDNRYPLL
jgi:hypothetical protein